MTKKKEEADQIVDMLHLIECDNVSVNSMTTLDKKVDDSQNGKPRQIELVFVSFRKIKIKSSKTSKKLETFERPRVGQSFYPSRSHTSSKNEASSIDSGTSRAKRQGRDGSSIKRGKDCNEKERE